MSYMSGVPGQSYSCTMVLTASQLTALLLPASEKMLNVLDPAPAWIAMTAVFHRLLSDGYKVCKWLLVAGTNIEAGMS